MCIWEKEKKSCLKLRNGANTLTINKNNNYETTVKNDHALMGHILAG